jgi:nitrite reductase/ring-hydroxylating ferredoxin subunit
MIIAVGHPRDWQEVRVLDPQRLEWEETPLFRIPGRDDMLIVRGEGGLFCIPGRCPHRNLPFLDYGRSGPAPGLLKCIGHGCLFELPSGRCVNRRDGSVRPLCVLPLIELADGSWAVEVRSDTRFSGAESRMGG